jgi:hypothetical protein
MLWGEESVGRTEDFEARRLDDARYLDSDQSGLLGVSATAPEIKPEDESAGLVEVEASGGGSAWRRRLAPRHRGAVKTFFAPNELSGESSGSASDGTANGTGGDER